jgi:phage terminase small subunit
MTEKQKKFCHYYILTGNGSEAARRAGYKGKNHDRIGSENLRKLEISDYIKKKLKSKDKKRIADQDEILSLITEMARGQMEEECIIVENTGDYKSKARKINKKIVPKDRAKALEMLSKINGMFIEKMQIQDDRNKAIKDFVNASRAKEEELDELYKEDEENVKQEE